MPGTWTPLTNQPTFGVGTMLLLTDGTVMCQNSGTPHWWKLTPDITGSYASGTWSALADGPNGPLYFASAVLRDGRVFVAGGEYNNGESADLLAAEIYDPTTNKWTTLPTPAGWTNIGDASCCVFPDGRVFLGYIEGPQCAIYDPVTNSWSAAANMLHGTTNEETWTLLQDQTIMACDCAGHPATEKYLIASNQWISCGNTPTDLVEASSIEIGPALCASRRPPVRGWGDRPNRALHDAAHLQPGGELGQRAGVSGGLGKATRGERCSGMPATERSRVVRRRTGGWRGWRLSESHLFLRIQSNHEHIGRDRKPANQ